MKTLMSDIAAASVGHVTSPRVLAIGAGIIFFWMVVMDGPQALEWWLGFLHGTAEIPL